MVGPTGQSARKLRRIPATVKSRVRTLAMAIMPAMERTCWLAMAAGIVSSATTRTTPTTETSKTTKNGKIGIIGTDATISSDSYSRAIHKIDSKIKVFSLACPLFVPLAAVLFFVARGPYRQRMAELGAQSNQ